jgi:hypothetical protein
VVKTWSNSNWNPSQTPCQSLSFWNFCRVLQISPKHFKFYQYKSSPVFRGTQLLCWMAFQILSGKGGKTWSTAVFTVHQTVEKHNFAWCSCSNRREKHRTTFAKSCRGMSHIQLSYLLFLSHSSTFWRNTQSKSRWPVGTQHDRPLERR